MQKRCFDHFAGACFRRLKEYFFYWANVFFWPEFDKGAFLIERLKKPESSTFGNRPTAALRGKTLRRGLATKKGKKELIWGGRAAAGSS